MWRERPRRLESPPVGRTWGGGGGVATAGVLTSLASHRATGTTVQFKGITGA